MKTLPIPETEQMRSMLDGSIYDLLCEYVNDPPRYGFRRFLTVDRQTLVDFLLKNHEAAERYFERQEQVQAGHDVERIWEEDGEYTVSTMDHGSRGAVRRFSSLAEAVAEHVLVSYGMY